MSHLNYLNHLSFHQLTELMKLLFQPMEPPMLLFLLMEPQTLLQTELLMELQTLLPMELLMGLLMGLLMLQELLMVL